MNEQTRATLTEMPNEAQAARMREAAQFRDGVIPRYGHTYGVGLAMLRALRRRGWVVLDNRTQPTHGTLTDAGRRALARYEVSKMCCTLNPLGHARSDCPAKAGAR